MEITKGITTTAIFKIQDKLVTPKEDFLAVEEPLEIQLVYNENDTIINKSLSITMRTPGNDDILGIGFLFTEGILRNYDAIEEVTVDTFQNNVKICFKPNHKPLLPNSERNFYITSSCGVCGKSSIDAIRTVSIFEKTTDKIRIPVELIYELPDLLRQQQEIFESTGGLHASALFDLNGHFIMLQEDVGRHNALDKLIGKALQQSLLPLDKYILLLSGRASFELIQKAVMAGIKCVVAVGAPSSLAVELAKENDITLIGFLRDRRCNIYSAAERIMV
ncbi:formate dehydrogenase accessory sulfurtransferase FdhD [Taibaiella lutea]|uniref:Sulfur carrier protein FdhD n=1 Tax=Taibaiella lutea TaxID=2608001 RepID=A0A5M6CPU4_9BACT|nr:formate dehydrogenase accessory sulfurtransferase FdhD [Taibaiella lutea]KAA5535139.1 formate dehydrogenase accessory sulfurtransferase FdhD [Taibaiella lutea]